MGVMVAPKFLKTQARIRDCWDDYQLILKGRRTGGTYALAYKHFMRRLRNETKRNLIFVSAIQRTSNEFISYMRSFFDMVDEAADIVEIELDIDDKKITQTIATMPNGSRIIAMPSTPSALRGFEGDVILDEFAMHAHAPKLYDAAQPLIMRGGTLTILSTPEGKENLYWKMVVEARAYAAGKRESSDKELIPWTLIEYPLSKAVEEGLVEEQINPNNEKPLTRQQFIDKVRRGCRSLSAYLQEYECVPEEAVGAWLSHALIHRCEHNLCPMPNTGLSKHYSGGPCFGGIDVGRTKDLTVIWISELVGSVLWTRQVEEIHHAKIKGGTLIPDQVTLAYSLFSAVKVVRVGVDKTGIGVGLCDGLIKKLGAYRVEGIDFGNANKEIIAVDLLECMEDGRMRIPECDEVFNDFYRVKKLLTKTGKVRLDAARVEDHADRFWAAGLTVHMQKNGVTDPGAHVV